MTTYQDVIRANGALASWALTEASGTDFAPWLGGAHLTGGGTLTYRQTGPFTGSFALGMAAGATLRLPFLSPVGPPTTFETWIKLSSKTPGTQEFPVYSGNENANGSGFWVNTNGHIEYLAGGAAAVDSTVLWPDLLWHLCAMTSHSSTEHSLALDGIVVWRGVTAASIAPNPNSLGFGCSSSAGSGIAVQVAYPSFYQVELTPQQLAANFQAATDPDGALVTAGGAVGGILAGLLPYVSRTYLNAP